jgi:hypothetical protein
MKFGQHLLSQRHPGWEDKYMHYKLLKKVIKALASRSAADQPSAASIGISLSSPAPTTAAAVPDLRDYDDDGETDSSDDLMIDLSKASHEDFHRMLEADMAKVQDFVVAKLNEVRADLARLESAVNGAGAGGDLEGGGDGGASKADVDAAGDQYVRACRFPLLSLFLLPACLRPASTPRDHHWAAGQKLRCGSSHALARPGTSRSRSTRTSTTRALTRS